MMQSVTSMFVFAREYVLESYGCITGSSRQISALAQQVIGNRASVQSFLQAVRVSQPQGVSQRQVAKVAKEWAKTHLSYKEARLLSAAVNRACGITFLNTHGAKLVCGAAIVVAGFAYAYFYKSPAPATPCQNCCLFGRERVEILEQNANTTCAKRPSLLAIDYPGEGGVEPWYHEGIQSPVTTIGLLAGVIVSGMFRGRAG